ncbi:tetratricopeptide repeat protein [Pseudalkalibacillus berkeleyi]|uniref:Tetratricopeptide repeat protein n=1 Tax=Pseudalkalibacillus berkeleyi TaxID=1069813 RepID=A0ABS9H345_9BACL|nr:tetratricopeptide repeat protein [Pseudalkalibacillus berkeleyi]MCF6139367.1 tetratricopeptide repeat protein [Pseudalkalibacillus berkeleyi]
MIGQRIRYYRKTKSLTQEELAKGICSVSYLSKIENGDAKSSDDVIQLLCERLGISPESQELDVNFIGLLNEWNYYLTLRKSKEAKEIYLKIEDQIPFIEDPNIILRYKLFLTRQYLTEKKAEDAYNLLKDLKKYKDIDFDSSLKFYHYFILGLYNYITYDYRESIDYFYKAEPYLVQTPLTEVEIATFYYNIALTLTHLTHNTSVISYANKALNIFDKDYHFTRSSDCQILLGIVNRRIKNYSQSEYHFSQALKFAESFNDSKGLSVIYHNLGYVHSSKGDGKKAIEFYHKSIKIKEKIKDQSIHITYYLIAQEYFNLGEPTSSSMWLEKTFNNLEKNPDKEYLIHYKVLKYRLDNDHGKEYEQFIKKEAIPFFQEQNILERVCEYATLLAEYYFNNSQYKSSSEYYKLALEASQQYF